MDVLEREQLAPKRAREHWYYRAKFQLLLERIKRVGGLNPETRVADVGCGVGLFMTFLEQTGHARPEQMVGIDPGYADPATALGGNAPILPKWPEEQTADLALLMDVLEHTPDDLEVLSETAGHVQEGGHVFITVPAFPWLYSAHDRFLGHYRRYTIGSLRNVINKCPSLEIVELHYFYASILPLAAPWRILQKQSKESARSDMKELPGWANTILGWITRAELKISAFNRVAGLSVVAMCRKTSAPAPIPHGRAQLSDLPQLTKAA